MNRYEEFAPLRILVIEDNDVDVLLLKEYIHMSGIPVNTLDTADSLGAAIKHLEQTKPDLIFLDLYLPDGNGPDSFDTLKEYINGSAVIILSGLSDTRIALDAIAKGAQDYLTKGEFDEVLLGKTIAYSVERRRNLEKLRHANERYKLVTKATHDLVWDWDLVTDEIYRDETSVQQVYGVSSNETIQNITEWNKRIHPNDYDRLSKMIQEIKSSMDKDFFQVEYQFRGEDGSYRTIYDRGYVVRNTEGKPIRLIGAAQDITERRRLEEALEESRQQQRRAITEATIKGQENERKELGKELHDNINQILATSRLFLDHAQSVPEAKEEMIAKSKEFIILAIQEIRKLSHTLLPPELQEFGLLSALEKLIDTVSAASRIKIGREWKNFNEKILPKDQKLTIYRIVQEQFNNIIKHAKAGSICVSLSLINNGKEVQLLVKDNGKGFDPREKKDGVGLRNIASRAELFDGNVTIQSAPGEGCELKVVFPVVVSMEYIVGPQLVYQQQH